MGSLLILRAAALPLLCAVNESAALVLLEVSAESVVVGVTGIAADAEIEIHNRPSAAATLRKRHPPRWPVASVVQDTTRSYELTYRAQLAAHSDTWEWRFFTNT